jgi:hypothetical protein
MPARECNASRHHDESVRGEWILKNDGESRGGCCAMPALIFTIRMERRPTKLSGCIF